MSKGFESQRKVVLQERLKKEHIAKRKAFAEEMKAEAKEFKVHCLEMQKDRKARSAEYKAIQLARRKAYAEYEKARARLQEWSRKTHLAKHARYVSEGGKAWQKRRRKKNKKNLNLILE